METVVLIIVVVFAVLQIMLFFKLWGATNDVKKIKEVVLSKNNESIFWKNTDDPLDNNFMKEVNKQLFLGNKNKALEILKSSQFELEYSIKTEKNDAYLTAARKTTLNQIKTQIEKLTKEQ